MSEQMKFSAYTKQLREAFPVWSKIRHDPNAIGSQFLGVTGLRLDEVEWLLDYAYKQQYIGTVDLHQVDIIYKATIPNDLRSGLDVRFTSGVYVLEPARNLAQFLGQPTPGEHQTIQQDNTYFIDYEAKQIYVHHKYDGHIEMAILDQHRREIYQQNLPLIPHHVWNFFDEFGLLLHLPRLPEERNAEYKKRILDVFKRPASATHRGLMNGIARELGLVYEVTWDNAGQSLILYHRRIDVTSILVDGEMYPPNLITMDRSGRVVLKGLPAFLDNKRTVSYIAGVELHELHNKRDTTFQNELFRIDGNVTPLLQYYVDIISNRVPIKWGQWKWNQGFWDVASVEMSGYGYVPGFYDAKISGWKGYVPKEG